MFGLKKLPETTSIAAVSLEALFAEAASLGGVRVWQHRRGNDYEATIYFKRQSGSEVEAKARNTLLAYAIQDAIAEARDLGANP